MGDDRLMTKPRKSDPEDIAKAERILAENADRIAAARAGEVERRQGHRSTLRDDAKDEPERDT
jgi:hypothetical protein